LLGDAYGLVLGNIDVETLGPADGVADGIREGFLLGEADEIVLGNSNGETLGPAEGVVDGTMIEGNSDGETLGPSEGVVDGTREGTLLGDPDEIVLGDSDRETLGPAEGVVDGTIEGTLLGDPDFVSVGAGVGDDVGAGVEVDGSSFGPYLVSHVSNDGLMEPSLYTRSGENFLLTSNPTKKVLALGVSIVNLWLSSSSVNFNSSSPLH
jgi:hypothetical protein